MDVFVYSRDAAGTEALRDDDELLERHWAYMDAFAESMIARGPTFAADRETVTGSLHVLGLPSVDAAHEFVAREPNNRAGVYAEHSVWRFDNLLGRTMWEFPGTSGEPRFLVIARVRSGGTTSASARPLAPTSLSASMRGRLILYGALSTLDDARPIGLALALQARERAALEALLEEQRPGLDAFPDRQIHDWELGGRR
jgi:uncharacterized protein YciI